ncbi:MAG: acyl-CoA thioesterase [Variovorax sp.]|nr:MAG: acyl-CoA thioesterase [Variovorax sp.]
MDARPAQPGARGTEFRTRRLIRFSDCDPAGIVFYPQYFVMFNGLVEDWVNEGLGLRYHQLIAEQRIGLPTVKLAVDFRAVSRMGDRVTLGLTVRRLGRSSLTLAVRCLEEGTDAVRVEMEQVIVTTSLETHRAIAIPSSLHVAIRRGFPAAA